MTAQLIPLCTMPACCLLQLSGAAYGVQGEEEGGLHRVAQMVRAPARTTGSERLLCSLQDATYNIRHCNIQRHCVPNGQCGLLGSVGQVARAYAQCHMQLALAVLHSAKQLHSLTPCPLCVRACVCPRACVYVCVRACVHVCASVCARACGRARAFVRACARRCERAAPMRSSVR